MNDGGGSVVETSYIYTVRRTHCNNGKDVWLLLLLLLLFSLGGGEGGALNDRGGSVVETSYT